MRWILCLFAAALAACSSPEGDRIRGGGPGGDVGNRAEIVQLHAGSRPYHHTSRRVPGGMTALDPAAHAREFVQR